jgi:hypothetical protein
VPVRICATPAERGLIGLPSEARTIQERVCRKKPSGECLGYCGRRPLAQHTAYKLQEATINDTSKDQTGTELVDAKIAELGDWRGAMLSRLRGLIKQADPDVVEEVKWRKPSNPSGVPVWSDQGMICTGEIYKDKVKLTFARGAALKDPSRLFNSSLEGNTRRAIDFREGEAIDEAALRALVRAAAELNGSS